MTYHYVMIQTEKPIGQSFIAMLSALLICTLFVQFAWTDIAYADDALETSPIQSAVSLQEISKASENSVVFLYCSNLNWDKVIAGIRELEGQGGLEQVSFLNSSGFGNLSSPSDSGVTKMLGSANVGRYVCPEGLSTAQSLTTIQSFISNQLPSNSVLVVVSAPLFNGGEPSKQLTPVIIYGNNHTGFLSSEITHRQGMITASDLVILQADMDKRQGIRSATDIDREIGIDEATLTNKATETALISRMDWLAKDNATIESMQATKQYTNLGFLAFVFASFGLSILLLVLGRQETSGSRRILIPAVRILWLLVLAYPIATFLMFTFLPARPTQLELIAALLIWILITAIAALLIGQRTKWVNSLIALFGLTIIVVVAGQLFPGPLSSPGYLTYDITEGSRYYGMGNEQGAMLFGSWIALSGLLINRFPDGKAIPAFKKWGFALGSFILLFVATSPWFGASFGPLVWGFMGCFLSWWLFNGRKLHWWLILIIVVAAFGLALTVLYADIALNPASHMHQVVPSANDGILAVITRIATDVWNYSFALIRDYVPVAAIVFFAFIFILLVVLRVLKPGTYREFWQRNVAFRVSYSVCFVLAGLTFLIEDSGIFTPAMLIIYPVAAFVWLICDLHSWHLRVLEEDGIAMSIKQLQQDALNVLRPKDDEQRLHVATHNDSEQTGQIRVGKRFSGVVIADSYRGKHFKGQDELIVSSAHDGEDIDSNVLQETDANTVEENEETPSVGRSTATMSVAIMLSRITGFGRQWAMAFALGSTALTSTYVIANNIPNQLYEVVAGGVLTTAFLPIYLAQLKRKGRKPAANYASNLLSISTILLGLVALLAAIFAPQVIYVQTFLDSSFDMERAVFFFRIFAIQIVLYGVGAMINGLLNAHRSFLWPMLGPVFQNIVVIITFIGYPFVNTIDREFAFAWLGIGTTLGVAILFAVQLPALIKLKIPLRFRIDLKDPALRDTFKLAGPAVLFVIMSVITMMALTNFATATVADGPATIEYARLWYMLPYGVIAVALSTALLTEMSEASAVNQWSKFRDNVRLGLRTTLFLIIPLGALLFVLSHQFADLYRFGAFTSEDAFDVGTILMIWSLALPFYAAYMFIYRVFSAMF